MTKLLQTRVKGSNFILSKAKKDRDIVLIDDSQKKKELKKREKEVFEVVKEDGRRDVVQPEEAKLKKKSVEEPTLAEKKRKRGELIERTSIKASDYDRSKELRLSTIATRGVVQLFNAVNDQRSTVQKELRAAGPLEYKKDKVLASFTEDKFLEKLKEFDKGEDSDEEETKIEDPDLEKAAKKMKRKNKKVETKKKLDFKKVFSDETLTKE